MSTRKIKLTRFERDKYAEYVASMEAIKATARTPEEWATLYREVQVRLRRERDAELVCNRE
jgi:uncharacterized protein YcfJ